MNSQAKIANNVVRLPHTTKKKKRLVFKPKPTTFFIALIIFYVLFSFARVELQIRQTERQMAILKQRTQQLELEKERMERQYQLLHDDKHLETLARKYLMIKPGERLVLPAEPGAVLPLEPEAAAEEKRD